VYGGERERKKQQRWGGEEEEGLTLYHFLKGMTTRLPTQVTFSVERKGSFRRRKEGKSCPTPVSGLSGDAVLNAQNPVLEKEQIRFPAQKRRKLSKKGKERKKKKTKDLHL